MSKKHYEAFAKLAVEQADRFKSEEDRIIFLFNMALIFKSDNSSFSKSKFLKACGVENEC